MWRKLPHHSDSTHLYSAPWDPRRCALRPATSVFTLLMLSILAIVLLLWAAAAAAKPLEPRWSASVVSLPYADYQGFHNETSGLDVFLGVRYGASTEGENRWRAAQPPLKEKHKGVLNATVSPPQCPQAAPGVSADALEDRSTG